MKSLQQAPASTVRWWGLKSAPAFDFVSAFMNGEGLNGPTTWREGAYVPYSATLSSTIKIMVGLSALSADNGYATFASSMVIYSKTIHDLAIAEKVSAVVPRVRGPFSGFVPCLTIQLSHLKWCQQPSDVNPSWALSLQDDTVRPNARVFTEDFNALMSPLLKDLKSDDDLRTLLRNCLPQSKPEWVKSDTPWFVDLPERLRLLELAAPT
ncbi:hypothetical protein RQP54_07240 [Curvibacter sp. APW13]|uniref:hypothetical protein n=1 Tax=Curvibacter sp. APW13 TaxID=3077236 RepID=UPI0028DE7DD9|nr:hypothetical protein [Curvibacter sp. APW13]MDT8990659.1 hypothetical protein [Curvibacter sp. APW13]